jgi:4-hydroxybenzoate polyprenyltransferase
MQTILESSRLLCIHLHKSIRYYSRKIYFSIKSSISQYWSIIKAKLFLYARLTRLNKPIGALLLMWPTLWGLWLSAEGVPSLHILLVFVLGVFLTRSAGCIANDMADYDFDSHVKRTKTRPLTAGEISKKESALIALALLLTAFLLVLTTNRYTVYLSIAAVPIAILYPFIYRANQYHTQHCMVTIHCQYTLGSYL